MKATIVRGKGVVNTLYKLLGEDVIICGGFVRYMCSPAVEPALAGDVDVYLRNEEHLAQVQSRLSKIGYTPTFNSAVAVSYGFEYGPLKGLPKLQLIKPVNAGAIVATGSLREIIESFDFTVVRIGLSGLEFAVADDDFAEDELNKRLTIKNIHCPISTIKRISKYVSKGYSISPIELLKLYDNWDQRTPDYKDDLRASLANLRDAGSWWELTEEDRAHIQTLLYQD